MNVKDPELVIVRGINSYWLSHNFTHLRIDFGGAPQAIPKDDAFYVGLYLEAPESRITHVGIVDSIDRNQETNNVTFVLKSIIKLGKPVKPVHAIRKHEKWTLSRLGLSRIQMETIRLQLTAI